jgi:YVTN family beta-propeller protein
MRTRLLFALLVLGATAQAQTLKLARTILVAGIEGRIDHFSIDAEGGRLFMAALGNNTVEVVDVKAGKVIHSIQGLSEPQGVCYVAEFKRLYVANGGDGAVRAFDGNTYAPGAVIKFDDDADNLRYDAVARLLYVGYGGGALGIIDVTKDVVVGSIALAGHPESFQLEKSGPRVFVNVPRAHTITVADRNTKELIAQWSLGLVAANFPMALDETNHRVFVCSRTPARLLVYDMTSGKELAKLELHGDCDDVFYDAKQHQIYATCGQGFIDVFAQTDADHYALKEAVPTIAKARTCYFDGQQLYLAVPRRGDQSAEIRCFRVSP